MEPRIVFEDTHVLVVAKPAGLLSQGDVSGEPSLVDWARAHVGRNYIGLVHRLDRNTSGLLVLGKRSKSANRLTESLQNGKLIRRYLGWVHGNLAAEARWEHWLLKDGETNQVRVVPPKTRDAKAAALLASPRGHASWKGSPVTLVEFELETGRSHQIRAQAAAQGHPLLGDRKYGERPDGFSRTALHSHFISFPHPMSGEQLSFEDQLPTDLKINPLR